MQEQINERSVSLAVMGTKLTGMILAKSLNRLLTEMKKQKQPKMYKGKQSVKMICQYPFALFLHEIFKLPVPATHNTVFS